MGDELKTSTSTVIADRSLNLPQAVRAACASMRDTIRKIIGSEPFIESHGLRGSNNFSLATYGAGKYVIMAGFAMDQLPGCCGVCVFYHASVSKDFQEKGLGTLLLELREEAARKAGYSYAMATVLEKNKPERHILEKAGFTELPSFLNIRTKNTVVLYGKSLR